MLVAGVLVAGHVWIAMSPRGLPAIRGILRGTVPAAWAAEHHPKWVPDRRRRGAALGTRPGLVRLAAAAIAIAAGSRALGSSVFT